jgi:hypothetical protein
MKELQLSSEPKATTLSTFRANIQYPIRNRSTPLSRLQATCEDARDIQNAVTLLHFATCIRGFGCSTGTAPVGPPHKQCLTLSNKRAPRYANSVQHVKLIISHSQGMVSVEITARVARSLSISDAKLFTETSPSEGSQPRAGAEYDGGISVQPNGGERREDGGLPTHVSEVLGLLHGVQPHGEAYDVHPLVLLLNRA